MHSIRASTFVLCVAVMASTALGVSEVSFEDLKAATEPTVVLFYDGDTDPSAEFKLLEQVEEEVPEFEFAACDVGAKDNAGAAVAGLRKEPPYVFVSTVDSGITQVRVPLTKAHLTRYLQLMELDQAPELVHPFTSRRAFFSSFDTPVFVMFSETACPHSFRALRPFRQAAGFFDSRVSFVNVDCAQGDAAHRFCDEHRVQEFPSFVLFAGEHRVRFVGGRSVAEFELFFLQHQKDMEGGAPVDTTASSAHSVPSPSDSAPTSTRQKERSTPRRVREVEVDAGASVTGGDDCHARIDELTKRVAQLEELVKDLMLEGYGSNADDDDE